MDIEVHNAFRDGRNIVLHGPSGTGKTHTMNELIKIIKYDGLDNELIVAAPTGMAAILINGATIHSQFGIRAYSVPESLSKNLKLIIGDYDPLVEYTEKDKYYYSLRSFISKASSGSHFKDQNLKYLFIDEISMTGAILLLIVDHILRKVNPSKKHLPMGGVQCIFSGDFFQLPPVKDAFCCKTKLWQDMNICHIKMEESKRYIGEESSGHFDFICRLRKAKLTNEDKQLLIQRKAAYIDGLYKSMRIEPLVLCAVNAKIDMINKERLDEIDDTEYTFNAADSVYVFSSGLTDSQASNCHANANRALDDIMVKHLNIKVGAQVIFITNYDIGKKLVNGRMCKVESIAKIDQPEADIFDLIIPDKRNNRIDVSARDLDQYEIVVSDIDGQHHKIKPISRGNEAKRFTCTRKQFPFKLAWAISIHRSQGLTLDSAMIDISDVFLPGQSYVAISRVSSVENIFITKFDMRKIYADRDMLELFA